MERWLTADGQVLSGQLPAGLRAGKHGRHFGPNLLSYILYQHHHCQVTQPLLREWGIRLSSGQLNRLLIEDKERFHAEKDDLLRAGLSHGHVTVDDSGARHQGRNGYVTQIGNEFFAWFSSTQSKSRVNFLTLLQGEHASYVINESALQYMRQQKLPRELLGKVALKSNESMNEKPWQEWLASLAISRRKHQQTVIEGALLGALLERDEIRHLAVVSDGAPQFSVLQLTMLGACGTTGPQPESGGRAAKKSGRAGEKKDMGALPGAKSLPASAHGQEGEAVIEPV